MKKLLMICFISIVACHIHAQDSTALPPKLTLNGYVKSLQTLTFDKNFNESISDNLIHNRINIKWKPLENLAVSAELRNRLFWGEDVKRNPNFALLLRNKNELLNLQKTWIKKQSLVLHTNVERLYVDFRANQWNARFGRQRINWGIATTWNPNDIFNTYNFLDFDYEERAGIDGAKFQYNFSNSFNTEAAYTRTNKKNGNIAALKYALNKWGYDMQLITGWYKDKFTLGAGWAGAIDDAGFKGEIQYFLDKKTSKAPLTISLEGDYMFKGGWYINVGYLFNNQGLYRPVSNWNTINLNLSPENLMPTKWNSILTTAKEFTPLFSANMSVLYAPGTNFAILFPSFQYNMATNLDLNMVWQSFFAEINHHFEAINHQGFLRLKWSF